MTQNEKLLERTKGILIGGAVGDALGMPTEFLTPQQIKTMYKEGVQTFLPLTGQDILGRHMLAGAVTDDTMNTLFILESVVKYHGKINAADYVLQLNDWVSHSELGPLVSGPSTKKALENIQKGIPLEKAGIFGTTNGASMKIAPIGLISDYNKMAELVENVYQICLPTHNTNIAIAAASAVAACVSYAASGGEEIDQIWLIAEEAVLASREKGFEYPSASLLIRMKQAKNIVENYAREEAIEKLYNEIGPGFESLEAVPLVLGLITLAAGKPLEVARLCANFGGDTDTLGAIATAICGGFHPEFPKESIELLETVNQIDFEKCAKEIVVFSPFRE